MWAVPVLLAGSFVFWFLSLLGFCLILAMLALLSLTWVHLTDRRRSKLEKFVKNGF
jgi:hypothetical protein